MNQHVRCCVVLGVFGLSVGCALAPGAVPEDMSAEAHEEQVVEHAEMAREHAARANASGRPKEDLRSDALSSARTTPQETHDIQAERHLLHAEDHLVAAEALREEEEYACDSVPPGVRESCPLPGAVVTTEATAKGARITVRQGTDVKALVAQIRCHIAVANTQGRKGMEHCPLYVGGVEVQQVGPSTIELTTSGTANIQKLQERTARQIRD